MRDWPTDRPVSPGLHGDANCNGQPGPGASPAGLPDLDPELMQTASKFRPSVELTTRLPVNASFEEHAASRAYSFGQWISRGFDGMGYQQEPNHKGDGGQGQRPPDRVSC